MTCSPISVIWKKLSVRQTFLIAGQDLIFDRPNCASSVLLETPARSYRSSTVLTKFFPVLFVALFLSTTAIMAELDNFAKGEMEFAVDMYSKIIDGKDGENVIFSPLSIQTCLALAHAGASGKTAEELSQGLRLVSKDKSVVADSFKQILSKYQDSPIVKIANKVYVKNGYQLKEEFIETAEKKFYSEAQSINFGDSVSSAKTINSWVEAKTNDKIKDLISADSLSDDTRCVLVNAIHFKGLWEQKFNKDATRKDDFWISEKESVKVDMMSMQDNFRYGELEDLHASVIEMPYQSSNLSMMIILPNSKTGLKELESKLPKINLDDISKRMYKTEVNLKLPRFQFEFEIKLNEPLKKMGMASMFDDANFDNLLKSDENLKISEVIHKAFIEVNEEGTEAAAATAIKVIALSLPLPSRQTLFIADKPFYFIIKSDSNLLFSGHYVKP